MAQLAARCRRAMPPAGRPPGPPVRRAGRSTGGRPRRRATPTLPASGWSPCWSCGVCTRTDRRRRRSTRSGSMETDPAFADELVCLLASRRDLDGLGSTPMRSAFQRTIRRRSHRCSEAENAQQEARLKMEKENLEKEKSVLMGRSSSKTTKMKPLRSLSVLRSTGASVCLRQRNER